MYRDDYRQGGYQMIPLHDPTGQTTARLCLEYSLYLAALPPLCWAAGLTSCMFAVESVAFNGLLIGAAWRFCASCRRLDAVWPFAAALLRDPRSSARAAADSNSSRGQAHARRLFLASLAYLPVFFGCLMLHHRRQPNTASVAAEDASAAHEAVEEALGAALPAAHTRVGVPVGGLAAVVDEPRERLLARGRELCIHEQMVADYRAADRPADRRPEGAASGAALGCPVVVAEAVSGQVAGQVAGQEALTTAATGQR